MMSHAIITAVIALMVTSAGIPARGAAPLTLDELVSIGEARNPSLAGSALELELTPYARRAAWAQFLPSIQVGYSLEQSRFYNPTYLNPEGTVATFPRYDTLRINGIDTVIYSPVPQGRRRNAAYFLRVDEVLFDGGRNYLNLKRSSLEKELREIRLRGKRMELRNAVTHAYTGLTAALNRLDLAVQVVEQRQLQLEMAQVRLQTGSVTRRDVLQAEVDLGRARNDSLQAALNLRDARMRLNQTCGLPLDSTYAVAPLPAPSPPPWDAADLERTALTNRPDFKEAELQFRLSANDARSARGAHLPILAASLNHTRSEQSGANVRFTLEPRNRYTSYGLTASWMLFDRYTTTLRSQSARVRTRQAQLGRKELEVEALRQVRSALDRLKVIHSQYKAALENSRLASRTLEFEQERYRLGSATVIELGAAQVSYLQAVSDRIRLESEFHTALSDLELAVGTPLEEW